MYHMMINQFSAEKRIKLTKEVWSSLPVESRQEIQKVKSRLRAVLDPGELDCYAYSVGMGIDAIISDDGDAREKITIDSQHKKIVLNFAQLLILAVKLDKFDLEQARQYFDQVIQKNKLTRFAPFSKQVEIFDRSTLRHPWIKGIVEE
ncbi:hypothetical protein ASG89_26240 [Paenibacillus sp. Soil766]|nr:hypothetical protein ASG89_26240 [Paenibacillus sp. Soil766]